MATEEKTESIEWTHLLGANEAWKGNDIVLRQGWRRVLVVLQKLYIFFTNSTIYRADARCVIAGMNQ